MNLSFRKWSATAVLALLMATPSAFAQGRVTLDFENRGSLDDFEFFGFDPDTWAVEPNAAFDDSLALHTPSNGEQLVDWFSRVAVLKASVFEGINVEASIDLTWDGDDDRSGIYLRFVDENNFYYLRFHGGDRSPNTVDLWRVKDGAIGNLIAAEAINPVPITSGETHRITFRVVGADLFAAVDGIPVPGIDPLIDPNPLIVEGRIGVGQNTNPTYFDNFELTKLDSSGFQPSAIVGAPTDAVLLTMAIPGGCNASSDVTFTIVSSDPAVASADPVTFPAGGSTSEIITLHINGSGSATITTTNDGGCADLIPATVEVPAPVSTTVQISSVPVGGARPARLVGDFGDVGTREFVDGTTYVSDDPAVATVDANGVVTGVSLGVANITASNGAISATSPVLVVTDVVAAFPEFQVEVWRLFLNFNTDVVAESVFGVQDPACTETATVVNMATVPQNQERIGNNIPLPACLPPGLVDWIYRATGFIRVTSLEPIQFGLVHRASVRFTIDGEVVYQRNNEEGDEGSPVTTGLWQPSRTGFLPIEIFTATGNGVSHVELTQIVGVGEHILVNDPNDTRSLRVFIEGCPDVSQVSHVFTEPINVASLDLAGGERVSVSIVIPNSRDGIVTVESSNPSVASATDVQFASFAESCFGAVVDVTGEGSTMLTLTNDMGFANGPGRELNVIPLQSIDLQLTSAAMEVGDTQQARTVGNYGAAGTRDLTDGAQFGTAYASSDPSVVAVDAVTGVLAAVGAGTAEITTTNEFSATRSVFVAERLTSIAFLVGNTDLGPGDRAAVEHLTALRFVGEPGQIDPSGLPAKVAIIDDSTLDVQGISANFDLLITSSTVDPAKAGGAFRCVNIPHIFWEEGLHREGREGMTNNGGITLSRSNAAGNCTGHFSANDPMTCQTNFAELFILDDAHPITQGLTVDADGFLRVYPDPGELFSYAATGPGAVQDPANSVPTVLVAPGARSLAEFDFEAESTILVAEAGGLRVDDTSIFLGRRVFLWLFDESFGALNDVGQDIFNRSVNWALAGERLMLPDDELTNAGCDIGPLLPFLESFEDDGELASPPRYTTIGRGFTCRECDSGLAYWTHDFQVAAPGIQPPFPTAAEGDGFWVGADLNAQIGPDDTRATDNDPRVLQLAPINLTEWVGVTMTVALANSDTGDQWEAGDFLRILVDKDNDGVFETMLANFVGGGNPGDTLVDQLGAGTIPPNVFTGFAFSIPDDATFAVIRFEALSSANDEIMAIDNLRLDGVPISERPPALVQIMGGLGSAVDTFISPLGESVAFNTASLQLSTDAEMAAPVAGISLASNGGGDHTLTFETITPGTCRSFSLPVRDSVTGGTGTVSFTLCHLPLDVNQDGTVNITDITAWGGEFNGARLGALVDTNGDGNGNVQDATAVGDNWFGRSPAATKAWNGESLP